MAQSKERYKVKITEEHIYEFKVHMILKRGRNVLALVIRWLNPDFSRNYVREYFEIDKYGMKNIKKVFNRGQINTLLAFEDEAKYENSFDISLLCRLVQIFCLQSSNNSQPVKDCLQAYLNNFKSIRNSVAHGNLKLNNISFLEKIVEIKHNLIGILRNAAQLYNAEDDLVNKLIIELINDIDIIRDSPNLDNLKDDAFVADLKKTYTRLSYISPSSNVFWDLSDVRVSGVFTEMKITTERKQSNLDGVVANTLSRGKDENVIKVDYIRLLDVINERQKETNNSNMAVLIEGPAGVGKTTLTRQIISDWSSETRTMLHLTNYDYVILSECRENNITSLFQLLVSLMPNSSKEIKQENFMENFEGKKLLFIIDGVHELTSSSEEVLRQILKMGNFSDIVIIYTSHPNQSKSFKSLIPDNFDLLNLEIHGIDKTYQEEFVIKYCKAMYNESEEESKVLGLLNYLRRKSYNLQDELKIPFNLILLIILWFSDSHAVNRLTSVTELFVEMHKVNQRKLEARLFGSVKTRHLDSSKTSNKLKLCLKLLYREALISHMQHNKKGIDEDSVQRLRCHCENLKLSDKVLSAFLVKEPSLRDEVSQQFCFPHKGMQDFYSALYIFEELKDLDISEILVDFRTVLQDHRDIHK